MHSSHTWSLFPSAMGCFFFFLPPKRRNPRKKPSICQPRPSAHIVPEAQATVIRTYGKTAQPISHPNFRRAWPPRSNPPPLTSPSPRRRGSCTSAHGDRRKHCTVTVGPLPCSSSYPFRRLSVRGDGAWVDEAKMCSTKWLDAGACAGGWQEWTNPQVIRLLCDPEHSCTFTTLSSLHNQPDRIGSPHFIWTCHLR
jgi:hypothetical protein